VINTLCVAREQVVYIGLAPKLDHGAAFPLPGVSVFLGLFAREINPTTRMAPHRTQLSQHSHGGDRLVGQTAQAAEMQMRISVQDVGIGSVTVGYVSNSSLRW